MKMRTQTAHNWEDCERRIENILQRYPNKKHNWLFRGQSDSKWKLNSTLERGEFYGHSFLEYFKTLLSVKPSVEAFTGSRWEIQKLEELSKSFSTYDEFSRNPYSALGESTFGYMVHLRHHGFPSPLLDWSMSPFVAAFFAFSKQTKADKVAIYMYLERPGIGKMGGSRDASIISFGNYVRSHKRHFLQKSQYTICIKYFPELKDFTFVNHEQVFDRNDEGQDELWKIQIPASERTKILRQFDQYNLNAFSLLASEDSLMETLAFRELEAKNPLEDL